MQFSAALKSIFSSNTNRSVESQAIFLFVFQEIIKNKQCGYDVRKPSYVSTISYFYRSNTS